MPVYMDVHIVPGVKAKDVAEAHRQDLLHQQDFGCDCLTYWIDETRENIFCLIEAPSKEDVEEMHRKAHGLIPSKIIEVNRSLVESFLGRIFDPESATTNHEGLKVFEDPSYRILLLTKISDPVLLKHHFGTAQADALMDKHNQIIRKHIARFDGREAEHEGTGFVVSFASASKAVSCALSLQNEMEEEALADKIGFRMALNAGEPVEKSNKLFGDAIQFASNMCSIAKDFRIALAASVKNLVAKDIIQHGLKRFLCLNPQDESLLKLLFGILEENWQNGDFDISNYSKATAMSSSQLYRKSISLTGLSPNALLKEYRLEKAKELMGKQHYNIAQITFDSGFSSASYFTKCFKKKYGLLPMTYLELLH